MNFEAITKSREKRKENSFYVYVLNITMDGEAICKYVDRFYPQERIYCGNFF